MFVLESTATGWKFHLKAANGEIIAQSEVYLSEAACRKGLESVRKNANAPVEDQTAAEFRQLSNPKYQLYLDKAGRYRFRLRSRNGKIIARSEGYTSHAACLSGIESVRKNAQ